MSININATRLACKTCTNSTDTLGDCVPSSTLVKVFPKSGNGTATLAFRGTSLSVFGDIEHVSPIADVDGQSMTPHSQGCGLIWSICCLDPGVEHNFTLTYQIDPSVADVLFIISGFTIDAPSVSPKPTAGPTLSSSRSVTNSGTTATGASSATTSVSDAVAPTLRSTSGTVSFPESKVSQIAGRQSSDGPNATSIPSNNGAGMASPSDHDGSSPELPTNPAAPAIRRAQVAGPIVGSLSAVVILGIIIYFLFRRRKLRRIEPSPIPMFTDKLRVPPQPLSAHGSTSPLVLRGSVRINPTTKVQPHARTPSPHHRGVASGASLPAVEEGSVTFPKGLRNRDALPPARKVSTSHTSQTCELV